jgi:molecular chaperone IbpA
LCSEGLVRNARLRFQPFTQGSALGAAYNVNYWVFYPLVKILNIALDKDITMRNFNLSADLTPLYRSAIGFDRLAQLAEHAAANNGNAGYPPYNIELLSENRYRITMAVAGFAMNELDIVSEGEKLLVKGVKGQSKTEEKRQYLHQGIAERGFERSFQLADHVQVIGAELENGLLNIDLIREIPEALKARKIEIKGSRLIE